MIINYVPGEECRIAIVEDGRLEELHAERSNAVSFVGNIYVGRVTNVEPSIQAAFVDFGLESNGFLHISDVHPRYFPGEDGEATEQIGKKTPRRERPPIQQCFRKGQEVLVQVLKEGINTKGPTLTSYLSIPGRYLVMLPDMDRVGVSRKVEDEDLRREMKKTLDQIELPEGFGFILRTAGEGRGKMELKRDLAYLQRLWKDIERRRKGGSQPRLLYAESDLLMRALRDIWTSDVSEIIIDNESALNRAARFMKIVAPRSATRLLHYNRPAPVFHAYGLEEQIIRTHARDVPLPGGGSLVIDETEAMVAIDVNSGKMRAHGDAETTAYKTNIEAVDEICRQLRLRDVGGLVLCDLIDMMKRDHRRDIENRLRDRMKRDRAATKVLPISEFGIVEMTRQRQKGSLRATHYAKCPICTGRGMLKRPDSVADDAMRDLAVILEHDKVAKIELVVSPRVAGELLSHKRQHLGRMEHQWKKHVDVRVSEDIPADRVAFYAYDSSGADVDLERLPRPRTPKDLPVWADLSGVSEDWSLDTSREDAAPPAPDEPLDPALENTDELILSDDLDAIPEGDEPAEERTGGKRRRRRRGRGRGRGADEAAAPAQQPRTQRQDQRTEQPRHPAAAGASAEAASSDEPGTGGKRRRRRRRGRGRGRADEAQLDPNATNHGSHDSHEAGTPIDDGDLPPAAPSSPRGDSWDIPASNPNTAYAPMTPIAMPSRAGDEPDEESDDAARDSAPEADHAEDAASASDADQGGRRKRRRRGRRGKGGQRDGAAQDQPAQPTQRGNQRDSQREPQQRRENRASQPAAPPPRAAAPAPAPSIPGVVPPRRSLYGTRRKLKPGEVPTKRED